MQGPARAHILALMASFLAIIAASALHGRTARRTATVIIGPLLLASLFAIGYCGPVAGFVPGQDRLMGWFVVGGAVLAALVHHLVLNRFTPVSDNGR